MATNVNGYVDVDDGKVYLESAGDGAPLVLLHAVPLDRRMWDDQWHDFSQRFAVMRFDLLGCGRSDPLTAPVSRRQELYRVLEAAGIERATLVGCSLSGETVLDVALERPGLVAGLVVVSAVPGGFELQGEPPAELLEMFAAVERSDLERAAELQLRLWVDGPFRQPDQVDALVRQRAAEMSRATLARATWLQALAPVPDPLDPPAAKRLERITAPTLIIAGELDDPEIRRAARVMADAIPGAQQLVIPRAAHLANMEQPTVFNRAVQAFLDRIALAEM
jgi:pimeloyl-ACP methyl ester carboxylesterase